MRPLRYSINLTLDGCCAHDAIVTADEELHERAAASLAAADALLFGRVTYQMMEEAFRAPADALEPSLDPFARTIDGARKYVVSTTLAEVDWNSELIRDDLEATVRRLKAEPGGPLYTGGVRLPRTLADLGLIDEYEFVVHPRVAGHGPTFFAGLAKPLDLELVDRTDLRSGAVALQYRPR